MFECSFLPAFFCMGAGLEYLMINLSINNVNFYKVYSKRFAEESAKKRVLSEAVFSFQLYPYFLPLIK